MVPEVDALCWEGGSAMVQKGWAACKSRGHGDCCRLGTRVQTNDFHDDGMRQAQTTCSRLLTSLGG